jgi:phosphopantetheinyl transferase
LLRVALARVEAATPAAPAWLGDSERARWPALPAAARAPFLASRALARRLLAEASGVGFEHWSLSAEAGTAPVAACPAIDPRAALHVSLAHRLGHVAAAVGGPGLGPVGVDVECERPARSDPGERAELMLAPPELARWRALPPADREPALLQAWVAKEAWFKAQPAGAAPRDFRRVVALPCAPAHANVRLWSAPPLLVGACCSDPRALAAARCAGLEPSDALRASSWRVDVAAR